MFNKSNMKWLMMLMAALMVLAGCSSEPPKEAVQTALSKTMDLQSYTFTAALDLDEINLPEELLNADPQAGAILNMLKDATLSVTGAYEADPMRMEMTADIALQGDMSFNLSIPMIMTEDKMWVKVPSIPMLPLEGLSGKFVEIDMKQLAEQEGMEIPNLDMDTQRKMVQDMMTVILKHFDEETYYSELKAEEVPGLPSELKPDQIVKFAVTEDNFEQTVKTIVEKVAPELIDLLIENDQYRQTLQLTPEDLEQAKQELAGNDSAELQQQLDELKEEMKINELSLTGAIKDDYLVYQELKGNVDIIQEGQTANIGMSLKSQYSNINEPVEFQIEIPTDAISLDELESMFNSGSF
ncbi:DUF6612 family protein [Paenibacillus abyssi]|uniref:Lipoprotein n=1 Tax=Paenibacillus abyssi TaxID=1340531 RepID=A0A917LIF1_9BACL|nr:DUF6612 family protein [Paenibacillus abyssi]GGG26346.1 hypothetical protein GCM10010916_48430 [Paenibacillus abyssi]